MRDSSREETPMPKMIFVNLPVSDLEKATAFYQSVGGVKNETFSDHTASCIVLSETIHVMLLSHDKFRQFTPKAISDARTTTEVLLAINSESRDDVDALVATAGASGGACDPGPRQDLGFMYSRSFEDPDGHIWEAFWMDPAMAAGGAQA
jgi:predicted lactoylglutathione lyase